MAKEALRSGGGGLWRLTHPPTGRRGPCPSVGVCPFPFVRRWAHLGVRLASSFLLWSHLLFIAFSLDFLCITQASEHCSLPLLFGTHRGTHAGCGCREPPEQLCAHPRRPSARATGRGPSSLCVSRPQPMRLPARWVPCDLCHEEYCRCSGRPVCAGGAIYPRFGHCFRFLHLCLFRGHCPSTWNV